MAKESVKDSVEFLAVNATGIGLSFGNLEFELRMFILICTAIYAVIKIIMGIMEIIKRSK
tara:strand:+ start:2061 stop:2240 length:180 start_codon:yes stop_codon:yes gene_type:complete